MRRGIDRHRPGRIEGRAEHARAQSAEATRLQPAKPGVTVITRCRDRSACPHADLTIVAQTIALSKRPLFGSYTCGGGPPAVCGACTRGIRRAGIHELHHAVPRDLLATLGQHPPIRYRLLREIIDISAPL